MHSHQPYVPWRAPFSRKPGVPDLTCVIDLVDLREALGALVSHNALKTLLSNQTWETGASSFPFVTFLTR